MIHTALISSLLKLQVSWHHPARVAGMSLTPDHIQRCIALCNSGLRSSRSWQQMSGEVSELHAMHWCKLINSYFPATIWVPVTACQTLQPVASEHEAITDQAHPQQGGHRIYHKVPGMLSILKHSRRAGCFSTGWRTLNLSAGYPPENSLTRRSWSKGRL